MFMPWLRAGSARRLGDCGGMAVAVQGATAEAQTSGSSDLMGVKSASLRCAGTMPLDNPVDYP
jgi:hypothetical protein